MRRLKISLVTNFLSVLIHVGIILGVIFATKHATTSTIKPIQKIAHTEAKVAEQKNKPKQVIKTALVDKQKVAEAVARQKQQTQKLEDLKTQLAKSRDRIKKQEGSQTPALIFFLTLYIYTSFS